MRSWYYVLAGQQNGPVSREEILRLVRTGTIRPEDLVWHEGLSAWTAAAEVPELQPPPPRESPAAAPEQAAPLNPYEAPSPASWGPPEERPASGDEIVPGSQPLVIGDCIRRAYELTKRHFWPFFGACAISMVVSLSLSTAAEKWVEHLAMTSASQDLATFANGAMQLLMHVVDTFFGLGLARIGLNIVSGKPFAISMLIGESRLLVRAVIAGLLYYLMVVLGLLLFIVPGLYLILRYGQYMNLMVDKELGIFEAFEESARITQSNKMILLGLYLLCVLIFLGGLLALLVGVCFTGPLSFLATVVAYRWLRHGRAVVDDGYRG